MRRNILAVLPIAIVLAASACTTATPYRPAIRADGEEQRIGYWGPRWSYWSPRIGRRHWDPYWGDPFWDRSIDVRTVERYEATAEIVLGRGSRPNSRRAFDARAVLGNLRDSIILPN